MTARYRSPSGISAEVTGYRGRESRREPECNNRDEDSEPTAAERAFDALRAEVAAMRQAMRSLPDVIKKSRPA